MLVPCVLFVSLLGFEPRVVDAFLPSSARVAAPSLCELTRSSTSLLSAPALSLQRTTTTTPLLEFIAETQQAIQSESLTKLRLFDNKAINGSAPEKAYLVDLRSVSFRPVNLTAGLRLQVTYSYRTNDIVKNFNSTTASAECARLLTEGGFRMGQLQTSRSSVELNLKRGKGKLRTTSIDASAQLELVVGGNDLPKNHLVSVSSPFLRELGITTEDGRVRTSGAPKHNQMQRFVEIVDGLVRQSGRAPHSPLAVADMGCGAGYLTFASHQHFSRAFQVRTVGVEARLSLVSKANAVAASCGIAGLEFVQGTIDTQDMQGIDLLVALHACDTATDDAIWRGIQAQVGIIVVAPCCHKEARRFVDKKHKSRGDVSSQSGVDSLLAHGIYRERLTEMVTDTCRALVLEMSGYDCKVFEFVGGEHTAKNVMIAATRSARARSQEEVAAIQAKLVCLRDEFGIEPLKLERHFLPI